jgi:NTE family protein
MNAYAILDGGGVKGAALVGCLKAAQERGVVFAGYGGTSAGSIVALLAAVGFDPDELRSIMVDEIVFRDFLDDGGIELTNLKNLPSNLGSKLALGRYYWRNRSLLGRIGKDFGLYNARKLQTFLETKIKEKLPHLRNETSITFHHLKKAECSPLKIVVSDLKSHEPLVFSAVGEEERNGSVIDAVRASMSYPFVFRPVKFNESLYVDGGLSSNLPVFLFERERHEEGIPVLAFDLISSKGNSDETDKFGLFCNNLFTTALESTDILLRKIISGIHYIQVEIPKDINTLDFALSQQRRRELFDAGYIATNEYFNRRFQFYGRAKNQVEQLQTLRTPPALVRPVLQAFAHALESQTDARKIRANIMLPTGYGTRIVVYQYGMDRDSDSDLELEIDAGCGGGAWKRKRPVAGDLLEAKRLYKEWGMTEEQQNKIRKDRKAMLCFPIFELGKDLSRPADIETLDLIGVLSVDTSTPLSETGWLSSGASQELSQAVIKEGETWADILSRILR